MGWDMVHEANLLGIWVPDFDDGVTTEMQNISFPIGWKMECADWTRAGRGGGGDRAGGVGAERTGAAGRGGGHCIWIIIVSFFGVCVVLWILSLLCQTNNMRGQLLTYFTSLDKEQVGCFMEAAELCTYHYPWTGEIYLEGVSFCLIELIWQVCH